MARQPRRVQRTLERTTTRSLDQHARASTRQASLATPRPSPPHEVERAINATNGARDAALIAILWETGARIAEIGNLQLKHLTTTKDGITLDVTGKTGQRSPMIVESAERLHEWLDHDPRRHDPEAPLWVQPCRPDRPLTYAAFRKQVRGIMRDAGIPKRVYPHLFRHSRVTYASRTRS